MLLFLMVLTTVGAWADTGNEADGVYYIVNGTKKNTATDGIVGNDTPTEINSSNMPTSLSAGWYVVTGNVEYTSTVEISGDVHLILADGCNMTVGTKANPIDDTAIGGDEASSLTIYGQGGQTEGTLTARGTDYGINVANYNYSACLTINGGQVTAIGGECGIRVCGGNNASVTINGGQVIATGNNGIYADGDSGSTITINGGKVDATSIYAYSDAGTATVKTADGKPLIAYTPAATELDTDKAFAYIAGGHTFTNAELTAIAGKKLAPNPDGLTYLDWDDTQNKLVSKNTANDNNTANDVVYVLQGGGETTLPGGWYVAKGVVSYTGQLTLNDDIHLILADGCEMSSSNTLLTNYNLLIYGQSEGTGSLTVTDTNFGILSRKAITINGGVVTAIATGNGESEFFGISVDEGITINGGQVTATANGNGIFADNCNITINGGQVEATGMSGGGYGGLCAGGTITLGWSKASDYIYVNKYQRGTVSIKAGQAFHNGEGNFYSGTIDKVNNAYTLDGKTLRPAYIITYNLDGGTNNANNPAFFPVGNAAIALADPTRAGYDFGGWYDNDGLTGTALTAIAANSTANVELWAKWTAHALTHHAAMAATCTETGNSDYWECSVCGKYFSDAEGNTEIQANSWVIPATGHTLTTHAAVAASCTTAGNNEYWECTACHKYFSDAAGTDEITENSWVIDAFGHEIVNGECTRCHKVSTSYIAANGSGTSELAMPLNNTMTTLETGWYVVNSDVTYTSTVNISGDVHLILADGYSMTVGTKANPINGKAIDGHNYDDFNLTIYGQGGETEGTLTATGNYGIYAGSDNGSATVTINGGIVTATGINDSEGYGSDGIYAEGESGIVIINGGQLTATGSSGCCGIYAWGSYGTSKITINGGLVSATGDRYGIGAERDYGTGSITINGGQVTATGNTNGIWASRADITLGWTNNTDYIYASNYDGTVSIKAGQTLYDGEGNSYSGTIDKVNNAYAIDGKTLRPYRYGAGTCGDTSKNGGADVTWSYDTTTKVLTISGTGLMMYYGSAPGSDNKYHSTAPWHNFDGEIEKVVVEDGVTYIGSYAFAYCSALTSVSLPASVVALGDYVCYSNNVIARIDIPNTTAAVTVGAGGFEACPTALQIAVPSTLLGTYQTATNWSAYAANLVGVLSETTGFGTTFATGNYEYTRTFKCGIASTVCLPFTVPAAQAGAVGKFYSFYGIDKSGANWEVIMKEATNQVTTDLMADKPYLFMPYIFEGMNTGDAKECTFSGTVTSAGNAGYNGWIESGTSNEWAFQGVYYNFTWADGNENIGKVYGFAASPYAAPDEDHDGNPDYTVNPGDFVKAAAGARIAPFRAFLQCNTVSSGAPRRGAAEVLPSRMTVRLVSADGTATAIGTLDTNTGEITFDNDWYDLNGRRLSGKPTQKGVYILNGKKVVIK